MDFGYIFIFSQLFVGALIGWLINRVIALVMIDKIVVSKASIADEIAKEAGHWLEMSSIADKMQDPQHLAKVKPVIEQHVDTFLKVKLQEKMPAIAMFVSGSTLNKLKDGLLEEIDILLPEVLAGYTVNMTSDLNVEHLVRKKINDIPAATFKSMILSKIGKQVRFFQLIGALGGVIIVIIQLAILWSWFIVAMSE